MKISIIVAASENNVIGQSGQIPWHLPDDMAFFKKTTMGHNLVMGRKTWESLGGRHLVGRTTHILTSRRDLFSPCLAGHFAVVSCQGTGYAEVVAPSINWVLNTVHNEDELMVCGGACVYEEALPIANRLYLTRVHANVDGDVYLPHIDWTEWTEVSRQHHSADARHAYAFSHATYERTTK